MAYYDTPPGIFTNKTAILRFATVDEIVKAYGFCIDNPFVNGNLIEVNGGYDYR